MLYMHKIGSAPDELITFIKPTSVYWNLEYHTGNVKKSSWMPGSYILSFPLPYQVKIKFFYFLLSLSVMQNMLSSEDEREHMSSLQTLMNIPKEAQFTGIILLKEPKLRF